MLYLEQTFDCPAANLVADLSLLARCEESGEETLRIWFPQRLAVILGRGNDPRENVDLGACERDSVPVLRRESGGGTVLLGPGCFCYSMVMRLEGNPVLASAAGTNGYFLKKLQAALSAKVESAGDSDLKVGNRKIAGHAQRRKQRSVLFHGSLLLNMDLDLIARYLTMPTRRPDYRDDRDHTDFLQNHQLGVSDCRDGLRREFEAEGAATKLEERLIKERAKEIYSDPRWGVSMSYATEP